MALTFDFYKSGSTLGDPTWEIIPFIDQYSGEQFISRGIILSNDSGEEIQIAFPPEDDTDNGDIVLSGEVAASEVIQFDARQVKRIAIKSTNGGDAYRLWAW